MNKRTYFSALLLLSLIFPKAIDAQNYDFNVRESGIKIGGGFNSAFSINIYESDSKQITKAWSDFMKKNKAKVKSGNEIVATEVRISKLSELPFNTYAIITNIRDDVFEISVACYLGGAWLSPVYHPAQASVFKEILQNFAMDVTSDALEQQLKMSNKVLKDKENELSGLKNDEKNLENSIAKKRDEIKKTELQIEDKKQDQVKKTKEIELIRQDITDIENKINKVKK